MYINTVLFRRTRKCLDGLSWNEVLSNISENKHPLKPRPRPVNRMPLQPPDRHGHYLAEDDVMIVRGPNRITLSPAPTGGGGYPYPFTETVPPSGADAEWAARSYSTAGMFYGSSGLAGTSGRAGMPGMSGRSGTWARPPLPFIFFDKDTNNVYKWDVDGYVKATQEDIKNMIGTYMPTYSVSQMGWKERVKVEPIPDDLFKLNEEDMIHVDTAASK